MFVVSFGKGRAFERRAILSIWVAEIVIFLFLYLSSSFWQTSFRYFFFFLTLM